MEFYYGNISAQLDHLRRSLEWIYPELSLGLLIPILLLAAILIPKNLHRNGLPFLLASGILFSAYLVYDQQGYILGSLQHAWFLNLIQVDTLSVKFRLLGLLASFLVLLIALMAPPPQGWKIEFWVFLLTALLGINLLCLSGNFLMVYLALETISLSSYLMTGYLKSDREGGRGLSAEASLKYFIYGSIATAAFLYGVSILYGLTGTLDFSSAEFSSNLLQQSSNQPATLALLMMWMGVAFKLSAFPMHFWSPDVYEGAPTPVAAFLSTGPKIAAMAFVIRLLPAFPEGSVAIGFEYILGFTAIISMIAGNTGAIRQNNLHRLLAWSGIAHTGYLLAVVGSPSPGSTTAITWYLLIYVIANLTAFACLALIRRYHAEPDLRLLSGQGKSYGLMGLVLVLALATLGGLPPTAGFLAKIKLFMPLADSWNTTGSSLWLILLLSMFINTIVGLYYYVRPVKVLYLIPGESEPVSLPVWVKVLLVGLGIGMLGLWG